jgi:hypothetical protein
VVVPVAVVAVLGVGTLIYLRKKREEQAFSDMMTPFDLPEHLPASTTPYMPSPHSSAGGGEASHPVSNPGSVNSEELRYQPGPGWR